MTEELEKLEKIVTYDGDKKPPDEVEVIVFGVNVNKHYTFRFDSTKNYEFEREGKKYFLRKEKLYKKKKPFFSRIRQTYMAFFNEGTSEPMDIDFKEPKVSSRIIFIALQNQTLSKGLASLFRGMFPLHLNFKLIFFVIVLVGVVAGIMYAFSTGAIQL